MDRILEKCNDACGIADDVAIYGRTVDGHDRNIWSLSSKPNITVLFLIRQNALLRQQALHY